MSWRPSERITTRSRRRRAIALSALFAVAIALPASARDQGIDSSQMLGPISSCGGGVCHIIPGVPDPDLTVTIAGPSELLANQSATYTISISGAFSPGIQGAGVHVAAFIDDILADIDDDVLFAVTSNTQITDAPAFVATGQFTHTNAVPDSIGVYSYDFDVLAPETPSELRLEGAMNAFDGNGNVLGEEWQVTTKIITVPEPAPGLAQALGALLLYGLSRRKRG